MTDLSPAASIQEFERFLVRVYDLHMQKGLPFDIGEVIWQIHLDAKESNLSENAMRTRRVRQEQGFYRGKKLLEVTE